jgi:hypothetical protein
LQLSPDAVELDEFIVIDQIVPLHPFMNPLYLTLEGGELSSDGFFDHCAHLIIADVILFLVETLLDVLAV